MARAKWQEILSHLALACFPIADRSEKHKPQQSEIGSALANPLLHQRGQCIDIVFVDKTCTSVFLDTCETIDVREANLQNTKVTLQKLLLIDHQLEPATLYGFYGITGRIETGCKDITRLLASGFQERLQ